jgi:AAA+ ATPase superfamily predicted ATPase
VQELIDREREQHQMLEAASSPPALIVMIGRRRVGKSFLLARTFTDARTVSFQGDEQSERRHLELLAAEVREQATADDALLLTAADLFV